MSAAGTTPAVLPRIVQCLEHITLDDLDFKDFDHISTVICLLQSCPNLQILDLKVLPRIITYDRDRVLNYLKAPNLMKQNLMKLKTMRIYLFKNPVEELILLKLLVTCTVSIPR
ncbi:Hypothetical predicted protein [Olea europaea subsp. europaea]|uniref:Uncharacterized protein n=1 Tax=Olea europaea subsp. europaea TaxID=158383 RepID=A0A8S0RFQ4_OLEEU|nr:Hypothetical predicted protein [Olea europaea subsp. europaea]